jgi:tRNA dimethylallyltransferase
MLKKTKGKPKLVAILGPTASGKTGLALRLAKQFRGEIVSADSRQAYKEMDIATAKPYKPAIPHHLIDILRPDQQLSVALYKKLALKAIKDIQKRNKLPFLVGGTGLYIQAIVDNFDYPKIKPNPRLRKQLEKQSTQTLFSLYKKLDPRGAKLIDKNNKRRLVRAIEVCKISGKPYWLQRQKQNILFDTLQIGIKLPERELKQNIAIRTKRMFKAGLYKEAKRVLRKYGKNLPVLQTIGYQEFTDKKGGLKSIRDYKEILEEIKKHTFQYAKRQMTWFKRDKRIIWINNSYQAKKLIKKFL